jgi:GntR family transcriptional regulator, transcriptional repressor for pyruvate dehydrogenase complex
VIHKPIAPIARATVTDQIVERMTAFILDAKLRPGDKLPSERDLMVQLGVGRSSLREAIKTLSAIGIVDVQIGDGMYVSGGQTAVLTKPLSWGLLLGDHSTREVIEARRVVEVELIGLATPRITPADLAEIGALWETMRANDNNAEAFTEADQAFHLAIAKAARNSVLYHVLDTLRHIIRIWIFKTFSEYPDRQPGFDEHAAIYAALEARDPDAARRAMAEHLDAAGARLLSLLDSQSGTNERTTA